MSTEIWATVEINGTPTHFQISNHGQLKNLKTNRIRKPLVNPTTGYCTQQLCPNPLKVGSVFYQWV